MTENNPDTDIWYKDKPIKEQVGERRLRLRERKKESESRSLQVAGRDRTEAEAEVEVKAKVERPAFPFHHPGREKSDFPTPISILVSC